MAKTPAQTAPIAVYGATGYTGRLVAADLDRRGAEFVLAGRNAGKLDALAGELESEARTVAVSLDDPLGLRELLEPCAAVIACAGPFTLHGEPVVAAAADVGTHYLDTTGEQSFIQRVFQAFGPRAERAGCALVPAMGFDYVPGDMLASLTAEGMEPLDEVTLAYSVRGFGATRGTMLSAMEILKGGDVEYRDGAWRPASQTVARGSWDFPSPVGRQRMIRYPAGEQITVPRHVRTRNVRTMLSARSAFPGPAADAAPVLMAPFQLALRTPVRRALGALVSRLPEGPDEESRRAARFMISCEARGSQTRRRGTVTGTDPYGLTAFATVHGALLAAAPGYDRAGALAPAQAFDPGAFLDALGEFHVGYEVDPPPRREQPAAASTPASASSE
jgi:short subunit dehydrogenase-like uncharacterized protein